MCSPLIEILTLKLELLYVKDIFILGIYRPPSGDINDFISFLDNIIVNLSHKPNIEVNLIGDMNVNFKLSRDPKTTKIQRVLKKTFLDIHDRIRHMLQSGFQYF